MKINPGLTRLKFEMLNTPIGIKNAPIPNADYGHISALENFQNGIRQEAKKAGNITGLDEYKSAITQISILTNIKGKTKSGKASLLKAFKTEHGQEWLYRMNEIRQSASGIATIMKLDESDKIQQTPGCKKLLNDTLGVVKQMIPEVKTKDLEDYKKASEIPSSSVFEAIGQLSEKPIPKMETEALKAEKAQPKKDSVQQNFFIENGMNKYFIYTSK